MAEIADINTPLLHNYWYVAGYADEFDEGLHERTFLDHSIVIFRTSQGDLKALQNRCAHRSFPLAHGWLEQDSIRCRYHGARYDGGGRLIEVPSMKACPRVDIRSYPMAVTGPLAWIWMGEPDRIGPLPDTSWLGEGWRYVHGSYLFKANWLLMAENLMDLTHVPFLHETSLSMSREFAELQIRLETRPESLTFYRDNPAGYQRSPFLTAHISEQLEHTGFHARSSVDFVSPALTVGGGTFRPTQCEGHEQTVYRFEIAHFITPKSQDETYYWYFHARNYCLDDAQLSDRIKATVVAAFQEDKFAIEHVQRMHEEDASPFRETHFKSDGPAVEMRRMIARLAAKEKQPA